MKDDFDHLCAKLAGAGEQVSDDEVDSLISETAGERGISPARAALTR